MTNTLKNENHKCSIVIPVYNSERYLKQCIDSVINQSYRNLEIICVNDGSTDSSEGILKSYAEKDSRIRVYSKKNEGKGAASARNYGLNMASGEYIQFLDSDDFFEPNMIEEMMTKALNCDADVVICTGKKFNDETQKFIGRLPHPDLEYAPDKECFSWRDCAEYICEIADFFAWNKLYRRTLIVDNDLHFTSIPISDDQDISMITLVLAERIAVLDKEFINYRVGTGSSQCDSQNRHPEAAYMAFYSVVDKYKSLGVYDDVKRSYLNIAIRLMREYFDRMQEYNNLVFLYEKYKNEVFKMLEAEDLPDGYFHDYRIGEWYKLVNSKTLPEILFDSCRASGTSMTTASLRFSFPYDQVKKNSRVILVGKGVAGRYWYSQAILSEYCNIILWVDKETEIPDGIEYDLVLKAY